MDQLGAKMIFANIRVGEIVCDPSMNHQRVLHTYNDTKSALLEDGKTYLAEDLDVGNHTYKHLVNAQ